MSEYKPQPINTNDIKLDDDLLKLTEILAKNVHEIWALSRIEEGWSFGRERNDSLKQHPYIIPYSQLPDSEREYDRNTAMNTLKMMLKLGYKITKK